MWQTLLKVRVLIARPVGNGKSMSDHKNPRQVFERVITLLKSGARAEAESLCRESIQRDPGDVNFMALLGTILAERNEWREAEECLRHAIRVAPGHARAHEDLGTVLLNQGQHAEALPFLEKAAELMPNNPAVFTKLGGALSALGRPEAAQRSWQKRPRCRRRRRSSSKPPGCLPKVNFEPPSNLRRRFFKPIRWMSMRHCYWRGLRLTRIVLRMRNSCC